MESLRFLTEWALRSSILIASGAILMRVLRVKDAPIRLAAWTAILCGSLAIPLLTTALPKVPIPLLGPPAKTVEIAMTFDPAAASSSPLIFPPTEKVPPPFDWSRPVLMFYVLVGGALLLRLCLGLLLSRRLLRASRPAGLDGVRESDSIASPLTLGIVHPTIVLPSDWRNWDRARLDAVLAHERSHIARHDPAVQLLSAIHRALLWYSPLGWFLHQRIVRVAEEASDDAAIAAIHDRAAYAEMLLEFMQRGVHAQGIAMARYGVPEKRIQRILDATSLSRGVTRWSVAAIVTLGAPLAYLTAAAHPQQSAPAAEQGSRFEGASVKLFQIPNAPGGGGGGGDRITGWRAPSDALIGGSGSTDPRIQTAIAAPPAEAPLQPATVPARELPVTPPASDPAKANYWQVAAASKNSAAAFCQTLKDKGFPAITQPGSHNLTLIWAGPYFDKESFARARKALEDAGFTTLKKP